MLSRRPSPLLLLLLLLQLLPAPSDLVLVLVLSPPLSGTGWRKPTTRCAAERTGGRSAERKTSTALPQRQENSSQAMPRRAH
jgi:hypothetical protein